MIYAFICAGFALATFAMYAVRKPQPQPVKIRAKR
jgi:hypothetical protein